MITKKTWQRTAPDKRTYLCCDAVRGVGEILQKKQLSEIFLAAYARESRITLDMARKNGAFKQDVQTYLDMGDLPNYVYLLYEREVLKCGNK